MDKTYSLKDLRYLMQRLRDPESGCSWDIKQDFHSIAPSTIEEAYEVVEAIECGIKSDLCEELGDLLFQVIFYGQLAEEEGSFTFDDVVTAIVSKLLRRHPHVFPDGTLQSRRTEILTDEQIKGQWEAIKASERVGKGKKGIFDDIPSGLPAMTRAIKLQKRAAHANFDWVNYESVLDKLSEEINELKEAVVAQDRPGVEAELGDVLFTVMNLSRHLKVEPESALRRSNTKFAERFQKMARLASESGLEIENANDEQLDTLWQAVKRGA